MPVADRTRDRVRTRLSALEETYDSFPVNQTTLTVSDEAYRRARDRCEAGLADVYVQVYSDDGDVLLVEGRDAWVVPHAEPRADERLEAGAERGIRAATGVECEITDLRRATILGVNHESDPDRPAVYRLVTVLVGEYVAGTPAEGAEWHSRLDESALPSY